MNGGGETRKEKIKMIDFKYAPLIENKVKQYKQFCQRRQGSVFAAQTD